MTPQEAAAKCREWAAYSRSRAIAHDNEMVSYGHGEREVAYSEAAALIDQINVPQPWPHEGTEMKEMVKTLRIIAFDVCPNRECREHGGVDTCDLCLGKGVYSDPFLLCAADALESQSRYTIPQPWPPPAEATEVLAFKAVFRYWSDYGRKPDETWADVNARHNQNLTHWLPMPPAPEVKG
jgi:hypothetical protein